MQNDNAKLLAIQDMIVQQYLLNLLFTNIIQKLATDAIDIFVRFKNCSRYFNHQMNLKLIQFTNS